MPPFLLLSKKVKFFNLNYCPTSAQAPIPSPHKPSPEEISISRVSSCGCLRHIAFFNLYILTFIVIETVSLLLYN